MWSLLTVIEEEEFFEGDDLLLGRYNPYYLIMMRGFQWFTSAMFVAANLTLRYVNCWLLWGYAIWSEDWSSLEEIHHDPGGS